jgi:hypothetical protein
MSAKIAGRLSRRAAISALVSGRGIFQTVPSWYSGRRVWKTPALDRLGKPSGIDLSSIADGLLRHRAGCFPFHQLADPFA